jgi:hypothetical protein
MTRKGSQAVRPEIGLVALVLAGCASVASAPSARENCGVAYDHERGWREIRAPKERQQLLELAARSEDLTTAKHGLILREGEREVWFRNSDGRVLKDTAATNSTNHRGEKFEYQFHSHVRPASAENARL